MASVGPTPCSGLKSDIASPIPKAHFETVLNMSPDAFATEARVVTQVARAGSDVFRLRIEADGRQYAPRPPGKGTACSRFDIRPGNGLQSRKSNRPRHITMPNSFASRLGTS